MTMLALYFSPGASSLASHIGLEESGAPYEERPTVLAKREQKTEAYLKINPRGKVPALAVDGRVITENTAILAYVAHRFPENRLLPTDPLEAARCIGIMAWFSNTLHPAYQRVMRPERFVDGDAAQASVRAFARKAYWEGCREIDAMLLEGEWIMGNQYTVADGYALVFYTWGVRGGYPMPQLAAYSDWKERMLARPAVRRILEREQNILVTAG
jgi:glutathione S-transferase